MDAAIVFVSLLSSLKTTQMNQVEMKRESIRGNAFHLRKRPRPSRINSASEYSSSVSMSSSSFFAVKDGQKNTRRDFPFDSN